MNDESIQILKNLSAKNRSLSHAGGIAVIAGLILEVILAFIFRKGAGFAEIWAPIIANSLVAGGVWTEIYFSGKASKSEEELQRKSDEKIAEANARAEEARERTAEIERLTAWRHLQPEQRKLIETFAEESKASLVLQIEYQNADAEAGMYAMEIATTFSGVGFERIQFTPNIFLTPAFGLHMSCGTEFDLTSLINKFREVNLHFSPLSMDLASRDNPVPNLYIFVGAKIPTELRSSNSSQIPGIGS